MFHVPGQLPTLGADRPCAYCFIAARTTRSLSNPWHRLFNHCPWWDTSSSPQRQAYHTIKALHLNAHQVREYLIAYAKLSDELPYKELVRLDTLFQTSEAELQTLITAVHNDGDAPGLLPRLVKLKKDYVTYLDGVKAMCEGIWAKFDLQCIILGLIITGTAIALNLLLAVTQRSEDMNGLGYGGVAMATWMTILCIFLYVLKLKLKQLLMSLFLGTVSIGFISLVLWKVLTSLPSAKEVEKPTESISPGAKTNASSFLPSVNIASFFSWLIMILYGASLFSNSYIVNEDSVTAFFFQSMVLLLAYSTIQNLSSRSHDKQQLSFYKKQRMRVSFDIGHAITSPGTIILSLAVLTCACTRVSQNFRACREEQWTCEPPDFLRPLSSLTGVSAQYKNLRYFVSAVMVVIVPVALRLWMKHYGNLNGYGAGVLWIGYGLPLSALCVCFHWALQALPSRVYESLPVWQLIVLPRIVYSLSLVSFGILALKPLCIYLLPQSQDEEIPYFGQNKESLIPKVYNHMKLNWKKHMKSVPKPGPGSREDVRHDEKPPLVYGLATVYSSSQLLLLASVTMVLFMLLGDGMSLTLTSQVAAMFLVLELGACNAVAGSKTGKFMLYWIYRCFCTFSNLFNNLCILTTYICGYSVFTKTVKV